MSAEQLGRGVPFQRVKNRAFTGCPTPSAASTVRLPFFTWRITGYLVGTMEKWNDAKKAEERDRVKHSIAGGEKR